MSQGKVGCAMCLKAFPLEAVEIPETLYSSLDGPQPDPFEEYEEWDGNTAVESEAHAPSGTQAEESPILPAPFQPDHAFFDQRIPREKKNPEDILPGPGDDVTGWQPEGNDDCGMFSYMDRHRHIYSLVPSSKLIRLQSILQEWRVEAPDDKIIGTHG
jgi:hypothetical protein